MIFSSVDKHIYIYIHVYIYMGAKTILGPAGALCVPAGNIWGQ